VTPSHYRGWIRTQGLDVADRSNLERYLAELNTKDAHKTWLRDAIMRDLYNMPNACQAHAPGDAMNERQDTTETSVAPSAALIPTGPDFVEVGTPEQVTALYFALAEARGEFTPVAKNRTSGKGTNKEFRYADLDASLDATVPGLRKHGLVLIQPLSFVGGRAQVRTTIAHKEGGRLYAYFDVPLPTTGDVQDFGKNVTYSRRYCYNAALCLAADQDLDDAPGKDAAEPKQRTPNVPQQRQGGAQPGPARAAPAVTSAEQSQAPATTVQPASRAATPATAPAASTSADGALTAEQQASIRNLCAATGAQPSEVKSLIGGLLEKRGDTRMMPSNYSYIVTELGRLAIAAKETGNG
jgi:hypothetical protein